MHRGYLKPAYTMPQSIVHQLECPSKSSFFSPNDVDPLPKKTIRNPTPHLSSKGLQIFWSWCQISFYKQTTTFLVKTAHSGQWLTTAQSWQGKKLWTTGLKARNAATQYKNTHDTYPRHSLRHEVVSFHEFFLIMSLLSGTGDMDGFYNAQKNGT